MIALHSEIIKNRINLGVLLTNKIERSYQLITIEKG